MHLVITTFYDGHDYRSIDEIFYIDENGELVLHEKATAACEGQNTCADMGEETYQILEQKVKARLRADSISFESYEFDMD